MRLADARRALVRSARAVAAVACLCAGAFAPPAAQAQTTDNFYLWRTTITVGVETGTAPAGEYSNSGYKSGSLGSINESAKSSGTNLMSAQAGGGKGSVGASKSFQERREALFQPRDFALLGNCQAICLPYDGVQSPPPPRRVYLKPSYLDRDLSYWTAKQTGQL